MFHFLEGYKVNFSFMINSYNGIIDLNRKLLPCRKTKKVSWKKFVNSLDSGIVKTCDELDLCHRKDLLCN